MKQLIQLALVATLLLSAGCDRSNDDKKNGTPKTADEAKKERQAAEEKRAEDARTDTGYFGTLRKGLQKAKDMQAQPAEQCVAAFKAMKGRLPKDIDELRTEFPELPEPPEGYEYKYDPATGAIRFVAK